MRAFLFAFMLAVLPLATPFAAQAQNWGGGNGGGQWSNVRVDDATGATRGMRVAYDPGADPTVTFTDCEGRCQAPVTVPAKATANGFAFTVTLSKGGVTRLAAEWRDDGSLRIGPEGKPWNGQLLRPE